MDVAILSMQRIVNYGSFLQAYALKRTIEDMGCHVFFADYHIEPCITPCEHQRNVSWRVLYKKIKGRILKLKYQRANKKYCVKSDSFQTFGISYKNKYIQWLGIDEQRIENPEADVLLIGSDEVFNCLQTNPDVGYSKELFGFHSRADRIISYAASFGNTTYDGLHRYQIDNEIGTMLKKFDAISVRDGNSAFIVRRLTGNTPEQHIDPVFLYNFDREIAENEMSIPFERYIVVYAYNQRIKKEEARAIRKFANASGAKLIAIGGDQFFCDLSLFPNPFEVLSVISKALFVFTDTFHGCVFSIKLNKPFGVFVRYGEGQKYGNSQKVLDMISKFHLQNRVITSFDFFQSQITQPIDYAKINQIINKEKEIAWSYLYCQLSQE